MEVHVCFFFNFISNRWNFGVHHIDFIMRKMVLKIREIPSLKEKGLVCWGWRVSHISRSLFCISDHSRYSEQAAEFAVSLLFIYLCKPLWCWRNTSTFISEKRDCQCYVHIFTHQLGREHVSSAMPEIIVYFENEEE